MSALHAALREVARTPVLLVACDFDGTISRIADRPDLAVPSGGSVELLRFLAATPQTHSAIISGRALEDLRSLLGERDAGGPGRPRLVGSHGLEVQPGLPVLLSSAQKAALARARSLVQESAASLPGSLVESKPASVTLHYRGSPAREARATLDRVRAEAEQAEGVHLLEGHMVLELCVLPPDKGRALATLRHRTGAAAVVFIGDDLTDEAGFAVLRPGDVGVKIGPGDSLARFRIGSSEDVRQCLALVAEERRAYLATRTVVPIEQHSMISDQRTIALLDPRGTVVWACLPRIDSAAIFGSLLGPGRGSWEVFPEDGGEPAQEYAADSMVLRTRWPRMTVIDYLDCSTGRPYQRAGRSELVRVIEGDGAAIIRFAPRLDFGRAATQLIPHAEGLEVERWPDPIVLVSAGVEWALVDDGPHQTATARVDLSRGPCVLELRYGTSSFRPVAPEADRRRQTERFWAGWAGTLTLPATARDLVKRSALVLKALVHGPSGAIAAAGTTSLPEHMGGERNWDYRFCWPRDACLAASALIRLGNTGVAMKLLDWLAGVVERTESPDRLHPVYTVNGSHLSPEATIAELPGYADSRPVRVGNAAAYQVQLDVFGPIVELVSLLAERGAPITPEHWRLVEAMTRAVALRWKEPDHGIWEIRGPRRHHVHTRAMCRHAVVCAIKVAELGMGRATPDWHRLRDEIAADVVENGFDQRVGAFTAAYGESDLDAGALAVGLTGLIDPRDDRFISTVAAVEHNLRRGRTVYRYLYDDGLPGEEGGWFLCTGWMIESMILCGRRDDAAALFEQMCECAGKTGLFAEEYDPNAGLALGNFPQAYSHIAVINSALALERA